MGKYIGIAAALAVIAGVGFGLGAVDFFFPPQAEVTEPSSLVGGPAAGSLEYVMAHTQLSHPLPYTAVVCQTGGSKSRCVYYVPKERK